MLSKLIKSIKEITGYTQYRIKQNNYKRSKLLQQYGMEALRELYKVGNKVECEVIPIYGTLLGFYREHDFIAHDDDVDVTMDIKALSRNLFTQLENAGFKFSHISRTSNGKGVSLSMSYKGLTCDITFGENVGEEFIIQCPVPQSGKSWSQTKQSNIFVSNKVVIPKWKEKIKTNIRGEEIIMPANANYILKSIYGEDFLTPKSNFHVSLTEDVPLKETYFSQWTVPQFIEVFL